MDAVRKKKSDLLSEMAIIFNSLSPFELKEKAENIERQLFEFANFMEAKIVLLYINTGFEVNTGEIIKRCLEHDKIVILPYFSTKKNEIELLKISNTKTDLKKTNSKKKLAPDPGRCKIVPVECIDIAIIPGVAFDEKGGRLGSGDDHYDNLIPKLPITTRKVAIAYENQIVQQVPTEAHNRHVDIIITEKRIIYKI